MTPTHTKVNPLDVLPEALRSLIPVTRESFYATIGQLNVHPCPVGNYDQVLGYQSDWKMHGGAGERVGASIGGTVFSDRAYLVTPAFYSKNSEALVRIGGES